jgi:hypothetical protein
MTAVWVSGGNDLILRLPGHKRGQRYRTNDELHMATRESNFASSSA